MTQTGKGPGAATRPLQKNHPPQEGFVTFTIPNNTDTPLPDAPWNANPEWLAGYPEEARAQVYMDRRRRGASLRLVPLPSGKRDPLDLEAYDAPSGEAA